MVKQKNKGGRPTKYTSDYPDKVYAFLNDCKEKDIIPLKIDLCIQMGLRADDIAKYSHRFPSFKRAIEMLERESEKYLIHKGLARKVDPNFAKFILAANYGYVETSKQIQEGNASQVIVIDGSKGYIPPVATQGLTKPITLPSPKAKA